MKGQVIYVEPWAAGSNVNLSGTGNVQSGALEAGSLYMLTAGYQQDIKYRFHSSATTAVSTDHILPAGSSIVFRASTAAAHVAVIGLAGANAHDASIVKVKDSL